MSKRSLLQKVKLRISNRFARLSYKRKCRLYCVGAAKTGTHSIASMFDHSIRSSHEPENKKIINTILALSQGEIQESEVVSSIQKRDKRLCLDVDSSQLNFFLLDYLLKEFPTALYLLTIRDCYSWLNSLINDSLRRNATKQWEQLRDYRFRPKTFIHPPEESLLKEKGLYTLDGYLSYWASHNNKVLSSVPKEQLMVVKTNEITKKAHDIADFGGIPRSSIQLEKSHSFNNPTKYNVLHDIPEAYLEAKVQEHCSVLMKQYFPEIQSISDSGI